VIEMATDTSKIAKAVADEIELRELQKELKIKEEINEQARRRDEFLSQVSEIAFVWVVVSLILYFAYALHAPTLILIALGIWLGLMVGLAIPLLIDATMDYKEGN
jgi:uncharacterized protein involved in exopolysaccharide biosynthesis